VRGDLGGEGPWSPRWQRRGRLWVAVTVPATTVVSAFVNSPDAYVLVLVVLAFGAYTVPGAVVGYHAVRGAAPTERPGYRLLHVGLLMSTMCSASCHAAASPCRGAPTNRSSASPVA
jgi:hypothetical protein